MTRRKKPQPSPQQQRVAELPPAIPGGAPGEGRTTSVQTNAQKPLFPNQTDPPPESPRPATADERESAD